MLSLSVHLPSRQYSILRGTCLLSFQPLYSVLFFEGTALQTTFEGCLPERGCFSSNQCMAFYLNELCIADYDEPHALMVLVEEELVMIDLETSGWPTFRLPYLHSVHSSAITCAQHVLNVPEQLWQKLVDAGDSQSKNFSTRVSVLLCWSCDSFGWGCLGPCMYSV